ncbi:hypothetical protein BU15DRAFT_70172 [Melanogaster broomeanus]|nr:hypothetical protein BU15DRAFT_70172 [Melanogaster broomeanus]
MNHIPIASTSSILSCRWDWCRLTFSNLDALESHVKHDHIWPMQPMRKADIALMRRLDLQSLHSSANTDSTSPSRGPVAVPSEDDQSGTRTPPLSYIWSAVFACRSPVIPKVTSFPGLRSSRETRWEVWSHSEHREVRKDGQPQGKSGSTFIFNFRQHPSQSSTDSRDVVEQHLTQEDEMEPPHDQRSPPPAENPQTENEFTDTELRWPASDDEEDESQPSIHKILISNQQFDTDRSPVSKQTYQSFGPSSNGRWQRVLSGSLDIKGSSDPCASQELHDFSQPFALQTQAPYFSQAMDGSQSQ